GASDRRMAGWQRDSQDRRRAHETHGLRRVRRLRQRQDDDRLDARRPARGRVRGGRRAPPRANIDKLPPGRPLAAEDRRPWLERVRAWSEDRLAAAESGGVACSALKRSYREALNRRGAGVVFVYRAAGEGTLAERLKRRTGHFMPPSLLGSQLAALEKPGPD